MSDTQTTTTETRPWGDRTAASGVEAVFLWTQQEMKILRDKFSGELSAAHERIDALLKQVNTPPEPPPAEPVSQKPFPPMQMATPAILNPEPDTGAKPGTISQEDHHEDQG